MWLGHTTTLPPVSPALSIAFRCRRAKVRRRKRTTARRESARQPADRTRRAVFRCLASGPKSVGELAEGLPVSRPAVSQHLKVLKCAGLVQDQAVGTKRFYQVRPEGVADLRAELDVFWGQALSAYAELVDEEGGI